MTTTSFKFVIPGSALRKIGNRAIEIILDRTASGIDMYGKPFQEYSRKPFFRPAKGIQKYALQTMIRDGQVDFFIRSRSGWLGPVDVSSKVVKSGSWWDQVDRYYVVIKGGYAYFKSVLFQKSEGYSGTVNLMLSGRMLGALGIVKIEPDQSAVTIGFTRIEEAQKASYHQISGAGRSKVKRQFMGLTATELSELSAILRQELAPLMRKVDKDLSDKFTIRI